MAKKKKWPKQLIAMRMDDDTIVVGETPEEISEDFADEPVGIYQLVTTGKFEIEKSINGKPIKKARR